MLCYITHDMNLLTSVLLYPSNFNLDSSSYFNLDACVFAIWFPKHCFVDEEC